MKHWKRLLILCIALSMVFLWACGGQSASSVSPDLDTVKAAASESVDSIMCHFFLDDEYVKQTVTDPECIAQILQRISLIQVGEQTEDAGPESNLLLDVSVNGESVLLHFTGNCLTEDDALYETENLNILRTYLIGLCVDTQVPSAFSMDFDDQLNYESNLNPDGSTEYLLDGTLRLTLPARWLGKYAIEGKANVLSFYHRASRDAIQEELGIDSGGLLFSIAVGIFNPLYVSQPLESGYYLLTTPDYAGYTGTQSGIGEEYDTLYAQIPEILESCTTSSSFTNPPADIPTLPSSTVEASPNTPADEDVKITLSEAKTVTFETYREPNGYFTMQIPSGWQVVTGGDLPGYTIEAYDPANPQRHFYCCLCLIGVEDKLLADVSNLNPVMGLTLMHIPSATAQCFFETVYTNGGSTFEVLENLGTVSGVEFLHALVTGSDGAQSEGIYYASVNRSECYAGGMNCTIMLASNLSAIQCAPGEFTEWAPVLTDCINSIVFSQEFWAARQQQWAQIVGTSIELSNTYNDISDMVMSSWESRSNSYDITMQQQSDATLGYDRVVDTQTGETYRADPGFLDSYHGSRYQAVPSGSDLYNQAIAGYIE